MKPLFIGMMVLFLVACSSSKYSGVTLSELEGTDVKPDRQQPLQISPLETIKSYRQLLVFSVDNPFRPQAMHRLADLLLDYGEQREIKQADGSGVEKINEYPEAILIYEELLNSYPNYSETDLVLYQLARVYDKRGEIDKTAQLLLRLVSQHQNSRYFSEANFRIAELNFLDGNYDQAATLYSVVVEKGKGRPFYEQSLLKFSWAAFKQDRFDDALESFFQLLDLKLDQVEFDQINGKPIDIGKADLEILTDILRGMTLIFALKNDIHELEYFSHKYAQAEHIHLIFQSLAELYHKDERYLDEVQTYAAYIARYPKSYSAAIFQLRLVDAYRVLNDQTQVIKAKEEFLNQHWYRGETVIGFSIEYAVYISDFAMAYLNDLTDFYHARFQKAKLESDFNAAVNWYQVYLKNFHSQANAVEKHFLFAEILFDNRHYQEAGDEFEQVAYFYPNNEWAAGAAYSAILSYQKQLEVGVESEADSWRQRLHQSAQKFISHFPDDRRVPNTVLSLASDDFDRGDNDKAMLLLKLLLDGPQELVSEDAFSAWMMVGHISFQNQDFLQAEMAYQRALNYQSELGGQTLESEEWLASSIYKQAEAFLERGEMRLAVEHLLRIEAVAANSKLVAQAKYDAAAALIGMEEWRQAAGLLEKFQTAYPGHELQSEVPVKLAYVYLKLERTADAANAYEQIANRSRDTDVQQEALLQSGQLYRQVNHLLKAIAVYKRYVYRYPGVSEQKFYVRSQLSEIYTQLGQFDKRDYWLNQIVKNAGLVAAQQNEVIQYYAASASLILAEASFIEFDLIKLVEPLRKNLANKKKKMELALAAYDKTSRYGYAEFVTAANRRIGEVYFKLSIALLESSRPAGLDDEEMEQYEMMLEEQAYPFEEQAIKFLESNIDRVGDGVYTEWVAKSFATLAKLLPVKYAKQELIIEVVDDLH